MSVEEVKEKLRRQEPLTVDDRKVLVEHVRGIIAGERLRKAGHRIDCTVFVDTLDPHAHCDCGALNIVEE